MAKTFDIDDTLTQLTEDDRISHRDGFQGNIVFGGVGSGKSIGIGAAYLRAYMRADYGMCCLTVKPEETEEIEEIAKEQGRGDDVIKISPSSDFSHDFARAEDERGEGSESETTLNLINTVIDIAQGASVKSESYWEGGKTQLLRNTITTLKCAGELVTFENIYRFIVTAPTSQKALAGQDFKDTYCYHVLNQATENADTATNAGRAENHHRDFDICLLYWTKEYPNLAEKTRSIIVSMVTTGADMFLQGNLRTVFSETKSRRPCPPELARQGKIIIVDMPVKTFEGVGVIANNVYKLCFQKAAERLPFKKTGIAVALYADECQHFLNDYDNLFLQTSRSAGCSVFFLTQSINNLITKYGDHGEAKAYNLLGLITNKYAMRNTCVKTNQYFADLCGQDWEMQSSSSVGIGDDDERITSSLSESRRYRVEPIRFSELLTDQEHLIFEAIAHNGRTWSNGENFLNCYFKKQ